jgi:hypothetical protein
MLLYCCVLLISTADCTKGDGAVVSQYGAKGYEAVAWRYGTVAFGAMAWRYGVCGRTIRINLAQVH